MTTLKKIIGKKENDNIKRILSDSWNFKSSIKGPTYISPLDVILMPWLKEIDNKTVIQPLKKEGFTKELEYKATITEITYDSIDKGEIQFSLPSKVIRETLGISQQHQGHYLNETSEVMAFYTEAGGPYRDGQYNVFISKNIINELEKKGYHLFWIVRLLREPAPKTSEKYKGKPSSIRDRTWLYTMNESSGEKWLLTEYLHL